MLEIRLPRHNGKAHFSFAVLSKVRFTSYSTPLPTLFTLVHQSSHWKVQKRFWHYVSHILINAYPNLVLGYVWRKGRLFRPDSSPMKLFVFLRQIRFSRQIFQSPAKFHFVVTNKLLWEWEFFSFMTNFQRKLIFSRIFCRFRCRVVDRPALYIFFVDFFGYFVKYIYFWSHGQRIFIDKFQCAE